MAPLVFLSHFHHAESNIASFQAISAQPRPGEESELVHSREKTGVNERLVCSVEMEILIESVCLTLSHSLTVGSFL